MQQYQPNVGRSVCRIKKCWLQSSVCKNEIYRGMLTVTFHILLSLWCRPAFSLLLIPDVNSKKWHLSPPHTCMWSFVCFLNVKYVNVNVVFIIGFQRSMYVLVSPRLIHIHYPYTWYAEYTSLLTGRFLQRRKNHLFWKNPLGMGENNL